MTKPLTGIEHRWGHRIAVDIPVQIAASALPAFHGRLTNLSWSGALIETDHELPLHAYIAIGVKLPETGDRATMATARVTRQLKHALGVEWCDFTSRTVNELLRLPSVRVPL